MKQFQNLIPGFIEEIDSNDQSLDNFNKLDLEKIRENSHDMKLILNL